MICWVDAQAGASGDMLLGALVDLDVPLAILQAPLDQLDVGVTLHAATVRRGSLEATKVEVLAPPSTTTRGLADVLAVIANLPDSVRHTSGLVFTRLAEAEASVHGTRVEDVHFHEVGAIDAIADVVATVAGIEHLGVTEMHCTVVGVGQGLHHGAHGPLPAPVPAVLELLRGCPVEAGPHHFESATPTGAALLATLVTTWGPLPRMRITASGSGAGTRDAPNAANLLRLVVGETVDEQPRGIVQFEANVDDLDPRLLPGVIDRLLLAGAHDAWITPILMKKGRPAFTVSALGSASAAPAIRLAMYEETSTIGLRELPVTKHHLDRTEGVVEVDGQAIRVKVAHLHDQEVNRSVEWDDIAAAAEQLGLPAKKVLARATAASMYPPVDPMKTGRCDERH